METVLLAHDPGLLHRFLYRPGPRSFSGDCHDDLLHGGKKVGQNGEFGHGAIEGVAGPEAANNSAVGGAYVPLMALGIPFTPAMAVVMAVLLIHGISPGPMLISENRTYSGA